MPPTYAQTQKTAQKKETSTAAAVSDFSFNNTRLQRKLNLTNNAVQRMGPPKGIAKAPGAPEHTPTKGHDDYEINTALPIATQPPIPAATSATTTTTTPPTEELTAAQSSASANTTESHNEAKATPSATSTTTTTTTTTPTAEVLATAPKFYDKHLYAAIDRKRDTFLPVNILQELWATCSNEAVKNQLLLLYQCIKHSNLFYENFLDYYGKTGEQTFLKIFENKISRLKDEHFFSFFEELNSQMPIMIRYKEDPKDQTIDKIIIYNNKSGKKKTFDEAQKAYFDHLPKLAKPDPDYNSIFLEGCRIIEESIIETKNGFDVKIDHSKKIKSFLNAKMIWFQDKDSGEPIFKFVEEQIKKARFFEWKLAIIIRGVARQISYILEDPQAEDKIAEQLILKIKTAPRSDGKLFKMQQKNTNLNEISVLAQGNPILKYLNKELNKNDTKALIQNHANDLGIPYKDVFNQWKTDAENILNAMAKSSAFLKGNVTGNFEPSSLGMFRLYRESKIISFTYSINQTYFIKDDCITEIEEMPNSQGASTELQNGANNDVVYERIMNKLKDAPITIRLHSSDLKYQKKPQQNDSSWFYHSMPFVDTVKIAGNDIQYHPRIGRDTQPYYSLWRTYKDHYYREMYKDHYRGKLLSPGEDSEKQQSTSSGEIQQSFGSLNFNYENNCYGLLSDYNYGNISLVLKKELKNNCIYTIGDCGKPLFDIDAVAKYLANNVSDTTFAGDDNNLTFQNVKRAILNGKDNEHLEVQIFKDIEFGKNKDIEKIYCVGVDDIEYEQLLKMVGEAVIFNEDGKLMASDKVQRY